MHLTKLLTNLPAELSEAIGQEYEKLVEHSLREEWDKLELHAGRMCEAVLRVLEWHINPARTFTPLDGHSKPNRKVVVAKAARATALDQSLRFQVPQIVEIIMDFRNNRNVAHLGGVNPSKLDGQTIVQLANWVVAELVRLESSIALEDIQQLVDQFAERPVPIVYRIGDRRIILQPELATDEKILVMLYQIGKPIAANQLREWVEYANVTRRHKQILRKLSREKAIFVEGGAESLVHLLPPGRRRSEAVLRGAGLMSLNPIA